MESYCCVCTDAIDACINGHTKCLKIYLQTVKNFNKLIEEEVPDDDDTYIKRHTLLHIACERGHGDCVKILLRYMDPNVLDNWNRTPLVLLCLKPNNREKIIKLLLEDSRTDTNIFNDDWGKQKICFI